MNNNWPTKEKDMSIAQMVIQAYADEKNSDTLSLFELVVNERKKRMNFRLADWVLVLAKQFNSMYGAQQGDYITRQVVSCCIREGHTLH